MREKKRKIKLRLHSCGDKERNQQMYSLNNKPKHTKTCTQIYIESKNSNYFTTQTRLYQVQKLQLFHRKTSMNIRQYGHQLLHTHTYTQTMSPKIPVNSPKNIHNY